MRTAHLAGSPGPAPAGGAARKMTRKPSHALAWGSRRRPSGGAVTVVSVSGARGPSGPCALTRRAEAGRRAGGAGLRVPLAGTGRYPFRLIVRSPYSQKCVCLRSGLYWLGIKSESAGVKQVVPARFPLSLR